MARAVDVVVVSYNSRETLRPCVAPLAEDAGCRVIVVDNASADGSLESIADLPVERIALPDNGGFGHGSNAGWRAGSSPYVLFLNPDARIDSAAVERLAARLDGDERIGIAGPRIVGEDGHLAYSIRRFPSLRSTYGQALFLHRLFPAWADEVERDERRYEAAAPAEWLSGACLLVRRSVLERLGGFDERFFLYCEDKDLCRRARDLGYEVWFDPAAVVVHVGGASAPRANLLRVLARSRVDYARKHSAALVALLERAGIALGELTHALAGRGGRSARVGHTAALAAALGRRRGS